MLCYHMEAWGQREIIQYFGLELWTVARSQDWTCIDLINHVHRSDNQVVFLWVGLTWQYCFAPLPCSFDFVAWLELGVPFRQGFTCLTDGIKDSRISISWHVSLKQEPKRMPLPIATWWCRLQMPPMSPVAIALSAALHCPRCPTCLPTQETGPGRLLHCG